MTKNMESINLIQQAILYDFTLNLITCKLFWIHPETRVRYAVKLKINPSVIDTTTILDVWINKSVSYLSKYIKQKYNIGLKYAN